MKHTISLKQFYRIYVHKSVQKCTVASKKVRLFYFIRFFQNNLIKIELYF